jgi:2-polyprenyl-3-methyl-5-hydroxy-6-metoxy-1,4-benzoquinol methylase
MFLDPISHAVSDYLNGQRNQNIIIHCDLAEDDIMEVDYFFRTLEELPEREKMALKQCGGKVLDVGACVGAHALPLHSMGHQIKAIDTSKGAIDYLKSKNIEGEQIPFMKYAGAEYDTLLFLMNGIGIAGKLNQLDAFLQHCSTLLKPGGNILCDSTDVRYFYEDEEGAVWMDLNAEYFGEFSFQMEYKETMGEWFSWLYLDYETLEKHAEINGFTCTLLHQDGPEFLAELRKV